MITNYKQLQELVKKYGKNFNLQQAIEAKKKVVSANVK